MLEIDFERILNVVALCEWDDFLSMSKKNQKNYAHAMYVLKKYVSVELYYISHASLPHIGIHSNLLPLGFSCLDQ